VLPQCSHYPLIWYGFQQTKSGVRFLLCLYIKVTVRLSKYGYDLYTMTSSSMSSSVWRIPVDAILSPLLTIIIQCITLCQIQIQFAVLWLAHQAGTKCLWLVLGTESSEWQLLDIIPSVWSGHTHCVWRVSLRWSRFLSQLQISCTIMHKRI
jgi:hypothetical protein